MNNSVLEENSNFNILELSFLHELDWVSYIIFIGKTASKKIGALILWNFFLLILFFISINISYSLA